MTFSVVAQNTHFESTVFGNTEIEFAYCVSSLLNNCWWFSSRILRMIGKIPTIYLFLAPFKLCCFHCSSPCIADGTKVKRMLQPSFHLQIAFKSQKATITEVIPYCFYQSLHGTELKELCCSL